MLNDERRFSFLCNPAVWMHPDWRARLPGWGVPVLLADILWQERHHDGGLSRFLAERFELHPTPILDLEDSTQRFLLMDSERLEFCLIRLGIVFLSPSALYILDGAHLRGLKEEFGDENFKFMRNEAQNFIDVKSAASSSVSSAISLSISKVAALRLGLAAFLKRLPAHADVLTRLWLKLPPFADEPRPPADLAQTRAQLAQIGALKPETMDAIFNLEAAA